MRACLVTLLALTFVPVNALAATDQAIAHMSAQGLDVRMDADRGVPHLIYDWNRTTTVARKHGDPHQISDEFLERFSEALFGGLEVRLAAQARENSLRTDKVRSTTSGTQVIRQQLVDGIPVHLAEVRTHLDRNGQVMSVLNTFDPRAAGVRTTPDLNDEEALRISYQHIDRPGENMADPRSELVIYMHEGAAHLAYRTEIFLWAPYGDWETFVDAHSGEVLAHRNRILSRKPVKGRLEIEPPSPRPADPAPRLSKGTTATGMGFVLPQNPLNNEPSRYGLRDATANMNPYREDLPLYRLDGSGLLRGDYVNSDNTDAARANEPSLDFHFSVEVENSNFHEVNVYWHIDTFQDYIQTTLGITNANNESQLCYSHQGEDDNSDYHLGLDRIRFGDGGVDDSEDGEIVIHEYGHALHHDMAGGISGGESGAVSEGFSDYLACSFADSPFEGEWDATTYNPGPPPFLRRVDTSKTYSDFIGGINTVWQDGEIISATWWDIREALGRELADQIILESFFLIGPSVTMAQCAAAAVQADQSIYGGAHAATIQTIFAAREIVSAYELTINHTPLPDTANTAGPYSVDIDVDHTETITGAQIHYRERGEGAGVFNTVNMSSSGVDQWTANIPGPGQDAVIYYYVTVTDDSGLTQYSPQNSPPEVHRFNVGNPTPVLVSSLRAANDGDDVVVSWDNQGDSVSRFFVLRQVGDADLRDLTPQGIPAESGIMEWVDGAIGLSEGDQLTYRLQIELDDGSRELLSDEAFLKYTPARRNSLSQNYPNPFNPETTIQFSLSRPSHTTLRIYDVAGRLVKELVNGELGAGGHVREWNGLDARDQAVSSGTYYYRIVTDDFRETRRMVLLK